MTTTTRRYFPFIEAFLFCVFVGWYIWQLQASFFYSWLVFPVWMIASFLLNGDSLRSVGLRADNVWAAVKDSALVFLPCIFAVVVVGLMLGAGHRSIAPLLIPRRFFGYMAFCLIQQVGLNSMVTNRLLGAVESPVIASLVSGALFALLHWPNPVLVPITGVGGFLMAWLFAKDRNIFPLAVWQGTTGTLVWWAFPVAWHHAMRVGPGFYHFHPR